jgi:hypothetical protein
VRQSAEAKLAGGTMSHYTLTTLRMQHLCVGYRVGYLPDQAARLRFPGQRNVAQQVQAVITAPLAQPVLATGRISCESPSLPPIPPFLILRILPSGQGSPRCY